MASAYKIDRTNGRGQTRSTVYFRDPDTGEKVCDGTYPKKIADERVRALLTQLGDPDFTNPKLGREPFRVYAEKWFAARPVISSTKKVRSYLDSQLLPAFGDIPLKDIDRFVVQEWVERLVDPEDPDARLYAAESIHSYYSTLSTIMKYAALDRHIPVSRIGKGTVTLPSRGLDTRVFLTLDQLEDLLEVVRTEIPYWYPMIKLVAETGMRWGEAAGITVDNLDLERRSVLVDQSLKLDGTGRWIIGRPKGGRSRRIGLELDTVEPLRGFVRDHPTRDHLFGGRAQALLFVTPDGRPLDRNNFRRDVWKPLIDAIAWLPRGLRFHDLRHTHISILLDIGTPASDVAERVGHASAKMTHDRYGHAMPHRDDRALSRLAAAKAARRDAAATALRVVS
jgi:integrase